MTRRLKIISYFTSAIIIASSNVSYAQTELHSNYKPKSALELKAPPCAWDDYYMYCEPIYQEGRAAYCLMCRKELFGY